VSVIQHELVILELCFVLCRILDCAEFTEWQPDKLDSALGHLDA
jgi:hypothetical protein